MSHTTTLSEYKYFYSSYPWSTGQHGAVGRDIECGDLLSVTAEHVGLFVAGQTQLQVSRRIGRREREDRAGGRTDEDRLFNDVDGDRRESDVERHVEEKITRRDAVDLAGLKKKSGIFEIWS